MDAQLREARAATEQSAGQEGATPPPPPPTIAVHCVAGLGRAPVLVAIALIELGMEPLDAVEFVRRKRRGAFNKPQIDYLVRKSVRDLLLESFTYSFIGHLQTFIEI